MNIVCSVFLILLSSALSAEIEKGDFNFDGHEDYRVLKKTDGNLRYYDHYIFSPSTGKHVLCTELSSLFNPRFDAKEQRIYCLYPNPSFPNLFLEDTYKWEGKKLAFQISVEQTAVSIDGTTHYVRVSVTLVDGMPRVIGVTEAKVDKQ